MKSIKVHASDCGKMDLAFDTSFNFIVQSVALNHLIGPKCGVISEKFHNYTKNPRLIF